MSDAYSPAAELLRRNLKQLSNGSLLVVNPSTDRLCRDLLDGGSPLQVMTQDYPDYLSLTAGYGVPCTFTPWLDQGEFDQIILFHAREKQRSRMLLDMLAVRLAEGGSLWVVGANNAGIGSVKKQLGARFEQVTKVDAARHCQLYAASSPIGEEARSLNDYLQHQRVEITDQGLTVATLPGVFSADGLDPATRMLLENLPEIHGRVLDFGCGCGVIGAFLSQHGGAEKVTAIDISALALSAAEVTLRNNEVDAEVIASDGLSDVTGRFDWIVSNPPFHRGVSTDYQVSQKLIEQSANYLTKGGGLLIVANRFLPYRQWLIDHFNTVDTITEDRRFVVYLART